MLGPVLLETLLASHKHWNLRKIYPFQGLDLTRVQVCINYQLIDLTMPQYNTKSEVAEGRNIYRNQYKETTKKFKFTQHLMFIWGGSCLKLIRHHILIWIVLYTLLSVLYRYVLYDCKNRRHKELFELVCIYAERFSGLLPITFITGFYVSNVVSRWWDQFMSLPWPDTLAMKLVTNIPDGTVRLY